MHLVCGDGAARRKRDNHYMKKGLLCQMLKGRIVITHNPIKTPSHTNTARFWHDVSVRTGLLYCFFVVLIG